MSLNAQQIEKRTNIGGAEQYARQLKGSGKTYAEVIEIMRAEGWINPRTCRPYGISTLNKFCLGLSDQRGKRNSRLRGSTAEDRAEYWRAYHREYGAKYRAENREYIRQKAREYRATETQEFREARLAEKREKRKRRLANETAEEREQRLAKQREYDRKRRQRALRNDK